MSLFAISVVAAGTLLCSAGGARPAAQDVETPAPVQTLPDLSGETITLDVEELDIRALLKLLAHSRRMNIVAGPEVTGSVSVNLFEVPFEEALDAILGIAGYTHFKRGDVVFVMTEAEKALLPLLTHDMEIKVYDVQHVQLEDFAETIMEFLSPSGKAVIKDDKLVVQDAPDYLVLIDSLVEALDVPPDRVNVFEISHVDPQEILATVTTLLSPNGQVSLASTNMLVVRDAPEYVANITELLRILDVPPRQVLISARILSVSRDDDLSVGVDFESSPIVDPRAVALDTSLPLFNTARRDLTTLTTGQAGIFSLFIRGQEQAFIEALSRKSNVETLSAPQLLTLDGETAKIQVGERLGFKIETLTPSGNTVFSVEFIDVGTLLEVTPSITKDGLVQLAVHPEVSTGFIKDGLPEEKTTEATTVMLVRDGETILIGGLINTTRQRTRSQVPILGDIPVLGLIFGRNTWKDTKSELIILITPHIVEPEAAPIMQEQIDRIDAFEKGLSTDRSDLKKLFKDSPAGRESSSGGKIEKVEGR